MPTKILIGADVVPTKNNLKLFQTGDAKQLVGSDLLNVLCNADYRICNLEVPLTDSYSPIKKCGPNLIAPTNSIAGYKALNIDLVTLANNHIMDHDVQGLESTIKELSDNGIAYVGAGDNLEDASHPFIIDKGGLKIGIYACAEHEFSIAMEDEPGANPYEPLYSFDHVKALREVCDYVVVLFHGGKEHYRYPSPNLQRIFRKFADVGATIVIAQHTHCVGCEEKYNNSRLIYGQGNFIFTSDNNEYWNSSLLVEIAFNQNGDYAIKYIPLEKKDALVRLSNDESILNDFKKRSQEILKNGFVKNNYSQFAKIMSIEYCYRMSGKVSRFILTRIVNRLTGYGLLKWLYGKEQEVIVENCLECEAHRELFSQFLRDSRKGGL